MPLDSSLDPVFDLAGKTYNVDPLLLKAMAGQESGADPNAVSRKGAVGLMQLMPDTAKGLGVEDLNNPVQSIFGGAQYLSQGLDKYKDPARALMYYHGGPDESGWGTATQAYPSQVLARYSPARPQVAAAPQAAVSGTDALAAVSQPPPPNSIAARRPDLAAANAAANAMYDRGTPPAQPQTGIDALAAVGRPAHPAPPQMAQAGGMSDEDLLNGFVKGTLPFMPKSAAATPPQSGSSPSPPGAAPAFNVGELINQYNQLRSFPMGMPAANSILQILQKMAPEGFQLNQDGSLALRQGYAQQANTLAASEAAGRNQQSVGPGGAVTNNPNAVTAAAEKVGAVTKAEAEGRASRDLVEAVVDFGDGQGPRRIQVPKTALLGQGGAPGQIPPASGGPNQIPPSGSGAAVPGTPRQVGTPYISPIAESGMKTLSDADAKQVTEGRENAYSSYGKDLASVRMIQDFLPQAPTPIIPRRRPVRAGVAEWLALSCRECPQGPARRRSDCCRELASHARPAIPAAE
jgi:hypothetical protein